MSLIANSTALAHLWRDAHRSRSELESTITERLKKVLIAAASVPHYRELMWQAGYDPLRDFGGLADLSILPATIKEDLKAAPESFLQEGVSEHRQAYFSDKTSGSTGIPLTVYRSPTERAVQISKWLRVLILNGYRPHHKVLSYTSPRRLSEGRTALQRFGLFRRLAVDFSLSPKDCTDALLAYQPDLVYGLPTSFLLVAEELERRRIKPPPLRMLVAGGEVIDAQMRHRFRQAFGVPVTETYGTVEMGVMAYQLSERNGLNLIEDCTFFEFLDEEGNPAPPGQPARVVVTDLFGQLMPLIRYELGDLAIYSLRENNKGETVRVIDRILGRQDDIFHLSDGSSLTRLDFYDIQAGYQDLQQVRITQHTADSFLVEVVANQDYFCSIKEELMQKLRTLRPLPLKFDIRLVESIPPDPNGKRRLMVSEVSSSKRIA